MCPVHEPAEVIPFIHAAKSDPVANGDRNALRKIDVVRHQQRLPVPQLKNEALMARAVVVIRNQSFDESGVFNPTPCIFLVIALPDIRLPRGKRHHRDLDAAIGLAACRCAIVCHGTELAHADRD